MAQKIVGRTALEKFWQLLQSKLSSKQDRLTAGSNITISGNTISATVPQITIDTAMSSTSTNPVQNKVVNTALNGKAASDHTHGNINNAGTITATGVTIANGDAIVITDNSASGKLVKTSITFNGSTTTKFLSQKGTWETPTGGISYEVIQTL